MITLGDVTQDRWDRPPGRESQPDGEWDPAWDPADALSEPVPRTRAGRAGVFIIAAVLLAVLFVLLCFVGTRLAVQWVDNGSWLVRDDGGSGHIA